MSITQIVMRSLYVQRAMDTGLLELFAITDMYVQETLIISKLFLITRIVLLKLKKVFKGLLLD